MNREQAKQLLPIIEAFAGGAEIELKMLSGTWRNAEHLELDFDEDPSKYRIKPERDRKQDLGRKVRHKSSGSVAIITEIQKDGCLASQSFWTFAEFDRHWEFIDA